MQKFNGSLVRQFPSLITGNAASGVSVTVYAGTTGTNLATLYSGNGTGSLSNPITTDAAGYYGFYAADGVYRLKFGVSTIPDQLIQLVDVDAIRSEFDTISGEFDALESDNASFKVEQQTNYDNFVLAAGWDAIGTFAAGFTYTQANQVGVDADGNWWRWAGALPKVVAAATNPTSDANYKIVSDAGLRQELAAPDSTVLVGGVEAGELIKTAVDGIAPPSMSSLPAVIDMTYDVFKGHSYLASEPSPDNNGFNVSSQAAAGQKVINLTANSSITGGVVLSAGQLICYRDANDEYYSNVIDSISGATLTLKDNIQSAIPVGANVFQFMNDQSHPNFRGYYTIADNAIRNAARSARKIIKTYVPSVSGTATAVDNVADSYSNPGSSLVPSKTVTFGANLSNGLTFEMAVPTTGAYLVNVVANTRDNPIIVRLQIGSLVIAGTIRSNTPQSFYVPVAFRDGGTAIVYIYSDTAGAIADIMPIVNIMQSEDSATKLSLGRHVLLGDSWFQQTGIAQRLEQRFSSAEIINKGVGGQTAQVMLSRFETDVTPERPDFVWLVAGTNDYFSNVTPELYNYYVTQIAARTAAIGAKLIVLTPSIGVAPISTERFALSRQYRHLTTWWERPVTAQAIGGVVYNRNLFSIAQTSIPAGATVRLAQLGSIKDSVAVHGYFIEGLPIKIGTKTSMAGTPTEIAELPAGSFVTSAAAYAITGSRFVEFYVVNTGGSPISVYGYVIAGGPAA